MLLKVLNCLSVNEQTKFYPIPKFLDEKIFWKLQSNHDRTLNSFRLGLTTRALFACRLPVEVFITFTLIHYYVHQDLTEVRQLYSKLTSIIIF